MRLRTRRRADFLPWSNVLGPAVEVKRTAGDADALRMDIRLSEVISALSHALDVTEGQPMGHAVRSCAIGMRIGEEIGLGAERALVAVLRAAAQGRRLLEQRGAAAPPCSAPTTSTVKRDAQADRPPAPGRVAAPRRCATRGARAARRSLAPQRLESSRTGGAREMTELRCERGADIARMIELSTRRPPRRSAASTSTGTAPATRTALAGDAIPLLGRILCLAQTVEVFFAAGGPHAALDVARRAARHLVRPRRSSTRCARLAATARSGRRWAASSRAA